MKPAIRESLQTLLELEGYTSDRGDGEEGLAQLGREAYRPGAARSALARPQRARVLAEIRERDPQLPVIMITAYGTVDNAVRAMQSGATTSSEAVGQRETAG